MSHRMHRSVPTQLLGDLAVAALTWSLATMELSAKPLFPAPRFGVGDRPESLAVGDFNGDGHEDIVSANEGLSFDLTVLPGNGDGTFAAGLSVGIEFGGPTSVAVGDLNEDGKQDLVTANYPDSAAVFLGNGDGTFTAGQFYSLGLPLVGPESVALGDFNGDGHQDLATADLEIDSVSVLFGLGDGTLHLNPVIDSVITVGSKPSSVAVGDFNEDGYQDMVTANRGSGNVAVLAGIAFGNFTVQFFDVGAPPNAVSVGDFNGDGHQDLVTANSALNGITVLPGRGNGTFGPGLSFPTGGLASSVSVGDFNGDGRQDVVATSPTENVFVLLGRGDGTFGDVLLFPVGAIPLFVSVDDFNGDGHQDLVTANSTSDDVAVLLGNGDGTFGVGSAFPVGDGPFLVAVGEFNGDGHQDLVTANQSSDDVTILLGGGDGTFGQGLNVPVGDAPFWVAVGDFDGDGRQDLVTANQSSDDVTVLMGSGDGSFEPAVPIAAGDGARSVTIGDFNEDDHQDLATANRFSDDVTVLLGHGDGTFGQGLNVPVGDGPFSVAVGDFDGDGHQDIVSVNGTSNGVTVLLGKGDGSFAAGQVVAVGRGPRGVAVGDWNGDGHQDLATANAGSSDVTVLLGHGDGTFAAGHTIGTATFGNGTGAWPLAVGDFDDDGHDDLITAGFVPFHNGNVTVLPGQGDGTFAEPLFFGVGNSPFSVAVGDFNGDGLQDVAAANDGSDSVTVLLNQGNHRPVAVAGADRMIECEAPEGSSVILDGSASTDADSRPGTNDDIISFEWFEDFGLPSERALGLGVTTEAMLHLGTHAITLRVTDAAGGNRTDEVLITVADTVPPSINVSLAPSSLWPANHEMIDIDIRISSSDACSTSTVVLRSVTSNEGDEDEGDGADIQGAEAGTADFRFSLRAERAGGGGGRTYTAVYTATDGSGNESSVTGVVLVPHDQGGKTTSAGRLRR